jgi:hypothetical protein
MSRAIGYDGAMEFVEFSATMRMLDAAIMTYWFLSSEKRRNEYTQQSNSRNLSHLMPHYPNHI